MTSRTRNWIEYVRIVKEFRTKFGRTPPSMLTEAGAIEHMRDALGTAAAEGSNVIGEPSARIAGRHSSDRRSAN
jgi:hypothetical protein